MGNRDILKGHISKTAKLTDEEFDYFFSHFKEESFKKGQVIIAEGDKVEREYFVLTGFLKAFFINDEAKMFILQFSMPAWWTSDYSALYNKTRATINIDCITDATILSISNTDREKLCNTLHEVEHFFRWRTNKGYIAVQKRRLYNASK